jgi:hypothetical protein
MDNRTDNLSAVGPAQTVSRRTFLEVTTGMFAAYSAAAVPARGAKEGDGTIAASLKAIETPLCTLRLDPANGNLCGVTWKNPQLEIIQEPRLGENFRLRFPRPGREANYFLSSQQNVSRIEERPDGVTCRYDSLRNAREEIAVRAAYHIRAVEGQLEFLRTPRICRWLRPTTASSAGRMAW